MKKVLSFIFSCILGIGLISCDSINVNQKVAIYGISANDNYVDKENFDNYFMNNVNEYPSYSELKSNAPDLLDNVKEIDSDLKNGSKLLRFSYNSNGFLDGMAFLYDDETYYSLGGAWGGYGVTQFAHYKNKSEDLLYYIYSCGSGIHRTSIGVFNFKTKEKGIISLNLKTNLDYAFTIGNMNSINLNYANIHWKEHDGYSYYIEEGDILYKNIEKTPILLYNENSLENKQKEGVFFRDESYNTPIDMQNNRYQLEVNNTYYFDLYILDEEFKEGINEEVNFNYEIDIAEVYFSYENDYSNFICFQFFPKTISQNNIVEVNFKTKKYTFAFDIIDYDFDKHGCITPSSVDDLSKYQEYYEMIHSIKYYDFIDPYPGLSSYGGSTYWKQYEWVYDFSNDEGSYSYNTDYLKYLTDSVYYPEKVDMVNENPIASRSVRMVFNDPTQVREGSSKTKMESFSIDYGVIDPGCTNPTNPLKSYSFTAVPKQSDSDSSMTLKLNHSYNYSTYYQLSKAYPEKYLRYDYNNIELYIILVNNHILTYFEDDVYSYHINFYYSK